MTELKNVAIDIERPGPADKPYSECDVGAPVALGAPNRLKEDRVINFRKYFEKRVDNRKKGGRVGR